VSENKRAGRRGRLPSGQPNPIDVHVGSRVRLRRSLLGWSQEKLGETLGLTFQQVQKYERGANRISASRLYDIARVLDVPVAFFFDDMSDDVSSMSPAAICAAPSFEPLPVSEAETADRRETLALVHAYYNIPDFQVRKRVYDLAKALADVADVREAATGT
jgi:transcriptional regulator with XRE-family HTH domain